MLIESNLINLHNICSFLIFYCNQKFRKNIKISTVKMGRTPILPEEPPFWYQPVPNANIFVDDIYFLGCPFWSPYMSHFLRLSIYCMYLHVAHFAIDHILESGLGISNVLFYYLLQNRITLKWIWVLL